MNKKLLIVIITAAFFFSACNSVPSRHGRVDINGMVYDTENRPVANYAVVIDGWGKCASDMGGRFVINGIRKGEHVFSGYGDGYLSVKEKITIYDKAQILYIRVPSVEAKFKEAFELITKKEYEEAEEVINEVLEYGGESDDALFFMSVIMKLEGNDEESENYLKMMNSKRRKKRK